jgi:hypothetical protein
MRLLLSLQSMTVPPQQDSSLLSWWLSNRDAPPQALRRSFDSLVFEEANAWIGAGFRGLALLTALVD